MHAFTAAHRDFPFGTTLRVTNLSNGQSVVVVVNDRGPFVMGRDLDLSYGAARAIGLTRQGTGTVLIEHLGRDVSYVRQVRYVAVRGPYTIQVGSFGDPANARHLKMALEGNYRDTYITEASIGEKVYYRVRIGKFDDKSEALKRASALATEGYEAIVMHHRDKE
jgi:rare lipoprotein A